MTPKEILDALGAAAAAHGLTVKAEETLGGASVTGKRIQAYIYPREKGGLTVDVWKPKAEDADQVAVTSDLAEAVSVAVRSALGEK